LAGNGQNLNGQIKNQIGHKQKQNKKYSGYLAGIFLRKKLKHFVNNRPKFLIGKKSNNNLATAAKFFYFHFGAK
jgi:hypothetical protein